MLRHVIKAVVKPAVNAKPIKLVILPVVDLSKVKLPITTIKVNFGSKVYINQIKCKHQVGRQFSTNRVDRQFPTGISMTQFTHGSMTATQFGLCSLVTLISYIIFTTIFGYVKEQSKDKNGIKYSAARGASATMDKKKLNRLKVCLNLLVI